MPGFQMSIMLELDHPHIIKLLDFFEERDNYFMVVEKVNGELVGVEAAYLRVTGIV